MTRAERCERVGYAVAVAAFLALGGMSVRMAFDLWREVRAVCVVDEQTRRDYCSDRGEEVREVVERDGCEFPEVECRD